MESTKRMRLIDWIRANHFDKETWRFAGAAQDQVSWVSNVFSYMIWNSLAVTEDGEPTLLFDERLDTVTVDGTHTSKSICLPVYRFDVGGVTLKIRGNFHDWCVRCWSPMAREFPSWMHISDENRGYYEGMENEESPVAFCVGTQEQMYSAVWWMLNEAIVTDRDDMASDPEYQRFVEDQAKHCRCSRNVPCEGVLAGGICDDIQDDDVD